MTYAAPLHFACQNYSTLVDDSSVADWVEACRKQLVEHVCPLWGLLPPGAALYPRGPNVFPDGTALQILFVDDDGDDTAAGEHGYAGVPFALVDVHDSARPSVVCSHEMIETTVNQYLDRWSPDITKKGHRYNYPLEPGDPVQETSYPMPVALPGSLGHVNVDVSNFVLPSWFEPASPDSHFDFMGLLHSPLEIAPGGYAAPMVDGVMQFESNGLVRLSRRKLSQWGRLSRLMAQGKR
jgi:hypothetical protein